MRMQGKTKHIYAEAERDIRKKLDDFLARFRAEDERRKKLVDAGEMQKAEYDSWRRGQVFRGKRWQALRDEIVDQIYGSNKTATRIMNDERRSVFIQNANRTAYELEKKTHGAVSFEIYDSATVTRLMKKDRKLLPYAEIKKMKDGKYNRKKVNNALTQSIIQGESMDKLAGRIAEAVSSKNASLMYSFARTMMTGAQNAGRLEAMRDARDMGIKVKKRWLATLDSRTRDTHRDLDGVSVDVDKPFVIDGREIMFPGDPHADADLVANCRCTLIYDYEDYPANIQRRDNETGEVIEWQTYREWEEAKEKTPEPTKPKQYIRTEEDEQYMLQLQKERDEVMSMPPMKQGAYLLKHGAGDKATLLSAAKDGTISNYSTRYFDALQANGSTVSHKSKISQPEYPTGGDLDQKRKEIVMELTGASEADAEKMRSELRTWTSNAWDTADTASVDRYIDSDGTYDGDLWRGLHFDSTEERDAFLCDMQVGSVIQAGRDGKNASWSNDKSDAETFASAGEHRVIIQCVGNKSAAPIGYMNLQGEKEVVSHSGARYTVLGIVSEEGDGVSKTVIRVVEREDRK